MSVEQTTGKATTSSNGKVVSSECPPFHLIPTAALVALADRFRAGVDRKGDKAWNAMSDQGVLTDTSFAIERLSHVIYHAGKLRDALASGSVESQRFESDAAAIMWGGAFLQCVVSDMLIRLGDHQ